MTMRALQSGMGVPLSSCRHFTVLGNSLHVYTYQNGPLLIYPLVSRKRVMAHRWDIRVDTCWLTGFRDQTNSGAIVQAHIKDKILCSEAEIGDPNNRFLTCSHLHSMFDQRLFWIDPDTGEVKSNYYNERGLAQIGLPPGTKLPAQTMTPERRWYLKQRLNGYEEFQTAAHLAMVAKREAEQAEGQAENHPPG